MAGKIIEINADQYQEAVLDRELAVLDFYSTECPPCEALASKFEALSEIYGDVLRENRTMLRLCQVLGFAQANVPDEPGIVRVSLTL